MVEKGTTNADEDPNSELNVLRREVRHQQAAARHAALQVAAAHDELTSLRSALALADTEVDEGLAREAALRAQLHAQRLKRQNVESTLYAAEALVSALRDIAVESFGGEHANDEVDDEVEEVEEVEEIGKGNMQLDIMDIGNGRQKQQQEKNLDQLLSSIGSSDAAQHEHQLENEDECAEPLSQSQSQSQSQSLSNDEEEEEEDDDIEGDDDVLAEIEADSEVQRRQQEAKKLSASLAALVSTLPVATQPPRHRAEASTSVDVIPPGLLSKVKLPAPTAVKDDAQGSTTAPSAVSVPDEQASTVTNERATKSDREPVTIDEKEEEEEEVDVPAVVDGIERHESKEDKGDEEDETQRNKEAKEEEEDDEDEEELRRRLLSVDPPSMITRKSMMTNRTTNTATSSTTAVRVTTASGITRRHSIPVSLMHRRADTDSTSRSPAPSTSSSVSGNGGGGGGGGLLRSAFGANETVATPTRPPVPTKVRGVVSDAHAGDILCVACSSNGAHVATGGDDRVIRVYDGHGVPCGRITDVLKSITSVTFSTSPTTTQPVPDSSSSSTLTVHGGCSDGVIRTYTKKLITTSTSSTTGTKNIAAKRANRQRWITTNVFPVHTQAVRQIRPLDDSSGLVVTCSSDRSVKVSDVERLKRPFSAMSPSAALDLDLIPTSSMSSTPLILSAHRDGALRLWAPTTAPPSAALLSVRTHVRPVSCVRASGFIAASLAVGGTILVSDLRHTAEPLARIDVGDHDATRFDVANGAVYVGAGTEGKVAVWNATSAKLVRVVAPHPPHHHDDVLGLVSRSVLRPAGGVAAPLVNARAGVLVCAHRSRQLTIWDM